MTDESPSATAAVRALAFYLPQFHPTPENDAWWGTGFTEWTNTTRARPLYRGHEQPHLPADLGFYDLRLAESRASQAEMAMRHGLSGFVYWHYWFGNGRRVLERPFNAVLASGEPEFGFCLGWANQTWTGIWHGADDRILIEQTYPGLDDERAHFDYLLQAFDDQRYIRVDGRPLFYVFRPEQLPDAGTWTSRWQAMARAAGLPGLFLVAEMSDLLGHGPKYERAREDGFDASVYVRLPAEVTPMSTLRMRVFRKMGMPERYSFARDPSALVREQDRDRSDVLPCIYPNWDNTPRSGRRGLVVDGANPELFRLHSRAAIKRLMNSPPEHRLLFIKSWNEWAEGNYLEPDQKTGLAYLEVLREELGATLR